jgi:predicted outer membrane repeat protein
MKSKLILFLMVIILISLSISSVGAGNVDNTTIQLTEQITPVNDVIGEDLIANNINDAGSFNELQLLINSNEIVNLTKDYTAIDSEGRIHINSSKTINGNGHTLNGNELTGIFEIEGGNIVFNNMTFINGKNNDGDGGAIYVPDADSLTFNNVKFSNNYAGYNGGAISIKTDKLLNLTQFINCNFENNCADQYGGAITYISNQSLIISNSTFKSNKCKGNGLWANGYGGAIYAESSILNISDSSFIGNIAKDYGGAIYTDSISYYNGKTFIENCIFNSNKANNNYGGAVYAMDDCFIEDTIFNENIGYQSGGAIFTDRNLFVTNSTFKSNKCEDDYETANNGGGAIYCFLADNVIIKKSFFENNNVDGSKNGGGAIMFYCSNKTNVSDSTFIGNYAKYGQGGAINAYGETNHTFIINSTFKSNNADTGGAVYILLAKIIECNFENNHADDYGGALYTSDAYIYSSYFKDNNADDYGGAIYTEDYVKSVDSIFSGNSAYVDGGAIYAKGNVNLKNSTFGNNKAEGASVSQCCGGAIRSKNDVKIDNCSFLNNHAADYGGAVYADTITWENSYSYFIGNYVDDNKGGAIYTNKFTTNNVKYGVFINNTVKGKDDGGSIYINKKNEITFSQCIFVNNHCGDEGGAIYLDSSSSKLNLVNNIFISNSAKEGQTVYNCGEYGTIKNNWWGGKNPSSKNDQLIEWKIWPQSNVHHSDSAPLELHLKLSENTCKINTTVRATAGFYNTDGSLCSGEMNTCYISFIPTSNIEFSNRTDNKAYVTTLVSPQKEGQYTITANLFNQLASDVLTAVNDSQYRREYAFNSADVMAILPDDEKLFDLPNEVYELPFGLFNEPYEGVIDSHDSLNVPNDSYNVVINKNYNIALNSNHVGVNNGNANMFSVISNVENADYTNSTNKTQNNSSVAKTIGNQSNDSSFNYLWILLLIAIFAGAGVLIKQYKN